MAKKAAPTRTRTAPTTSTKTAATRRGALEVKAPSAGSAQTSGGWARPAGASSIHDNATPFAPWTPEHANTPAVPNAPDSYRLTDAERAAGGVLTSTGAKMNQGERDWNALWARQTGTKEKPEGKPLIEWDSAGYHYAQNPDRSIVQTKIKG